VSCRVLYRGAFFVAMWVCLLERTIVAACRFGRESCMP
jgi:hypothetical protein